MNNVEDSTGGDAVKRVCSGWTRMTAEEWHPKGTKPGVEEMRANVLRRAALWESKQQPRPAHWKFNKCILWLEKHSVVSTSSPVQKTVAQQRKDLAPSSDEDEEISSQVTNTEPLRPQVGTKIPISISFGYGGQPESDTNSQSPKDTTNNSSQTLRWARPRCVPRMINFFVSMLYLFLQRDADILRYQLDAKDKDWFWRMAASKFNTADADDINFNLFRNDESYPEELQKLDLYSRDGYAVTLSNLEVEFRDVRSSLMKGLSNSRKSCMGEQDAEYFNPEKHVYSSNFFDFCRDDMCVFCLYCAAVKYGLLVSAMVHMPDDACHNGTTTSNTYLGRSGRSLTERGIEQIGMALNNPICIAQMEDKACLQGMKR